MTAPFDFNDSLNFKQAVSDYLSTNRTRPGPFLLSLIPAQMPLFPPTHS
jgi:hypothetical protein